MQKKVYHFEINMDTINEINESNYLKLYPNYIAKNVVFLNSDSSLDSFFLIKEETYILEFTEALKSLKISFKIKDVTSDFLDEKLGLNPSQIDQFNYLYY